MGRSRNKVVWCNRGWLPTHFGFCPSEKAWDREMKRLQVEDEPYPRTDGRCTTLANRASGKFCILVTIGEHIDPKDDPIGVLGLIVHEAAHVWQQIKKDIGEKRPSAEFEAYALQAIFIQLSSAYTDTRGIRGVVK